MSNKTLYSIIGIIILIIVGYFAYAAFSQKDAVVETNTPAQSEAKLDIDMICDGVLAYTTFPDAASAEKYVIECKEGKHPEVIENYKAQMNLGDGAEI